MTATGLCGTILHVRPKGNADDKGYRVWVCVANAVRTSSHRVHRAPE